MKFIKYCVCLFVLSSCNLEERGSTHYIALLKNSTQHSIKILSYTSGVVLPKDTIKLVNGQELEIANGYDQGIGTSPGFYTQYFVGEPKDSVLVVFDNTYSIVHYRQAPEFKSNKYYLQISNRNLMNLDSYSFTSTRITKRSQENVHIYTFTEQDYLDAK